MKKESNEELLTRGISAIYPSKEFVLSKINHGQKVTLYLGIDPTGPTLHLGHAIALKKLSEFQKAGHRIILLMGDFTAMIGDPTDKTATRRQLSHTEVMNNLKNYKKQASKLISFTGKNKAQFKFNSKWLSNMKFEEIIKLASLMTVQQMLERDMFDKRIKEGKPISLNEFLYPLMQGYDSVAMNVDGEIGGNDQTFNMLCGRNLMKDIKNKEKFVITTKLLEDNSGKKMGKTENNAVTLSDSPKEMYGKIMSWKDDLIILGFELCTNISMPEIEKIASDLVSGTTNPRDLKMKLAYQVVDIYYGSKEAETAEREFVKTFQKKEKPEDLTKLVASKNDLLVDIFLKNHLVSSKSEFRRLVDGHSIINLDQDKKITDHNAKANKGIYRIGKKRFCKIDIN